jgi:glutamine amidotransferase
MQLMAEKGLEFGERAGLGWIPGEVRRLRPADPRAKIPHMGWNTLEMSQPRHALFAGVPENTHMYFVHSFAFHPTNPGLTIASADHAGRFTAAIAKDNLAGVQFHPEKSQAAGLALIGRFLEWKP